jgi:ABC-2 type transport system ATP-binding protein
MITGFLPPTSGRVTVAGNDLFEAPRQARRQLGYLPETVALYGEMRVAEYLSYRARLEGLGRGEARAAVREAMDQCLVADVSHQLIGTLSKGYKQRVGLATAILHKPRVLVLDEPTVGLDPNQVRAIRELIRQLGRERTLLLSTHILPEVELLCDRVIIIDRGRIVAEGTPASLRESAVGAPGVRVTVKGDPADASDRLGQIPGVAGVRAGSEPGAWVLDCEPGGDPREEVFRLAVAAGWTLVELAKDHGASLEEIFVRLTTHDVTEEAA